VKQEFYLVKAKLEAMLAVIFYSEHHSLLALEHIKFLACLGIFVCIACVVRGEFSCFDPVESKCLLILGIRSSSVILTGRPQEIPEVVYAFNHTLSQNTMNYLFCMILLEGDKFS
jgi:hypothetical protein